MLRNIILVENIIKSSKCKSNTIAKRYGHFMRGKPPGVARSLERRLNDENPIDEEVIRKINIGFPRLKPSRSLEIRERLTHIKARKNDAELERKSRNGTLLIDLDKVKEEHDKRAGHFPLKTIAEHYGIFKDLFGAAYFVPRVPLDIKFKFEDCYCPVHCGNVILPSEAQQQPEVLFDGAVNLLKEKSKGGNLWSLVMTNPDGHFSGEEKEYIHWFLANIPESDISKAEEIVPYIQPFPAKGLGYQRFIFILYKQEGKLDLSNYKIMSGNDLNKRTFSTFEFYKNHQEQITPAGLAFFQSTWDKSLTNFFHETLDMKEPVYEYDFPKPYISKPKMFPLRQPFNLYLDKYQDLKEVQKRYLEKKLEKTHPFNGPEPPLRFPNAHPLKNIPSWLRTEIKKDRLKIGRINDI